MSLPANFVNYYKLLDIPINANPSEISSGYKDAIARSSNIQHRKLCDDALAVLKDSDSRDMYDGLLVQWHQEHHENGTNKTKIAVRIVGDASEEIDVATKLIEEADEVFFNHKYSDLNRLQNARRELHRLCRDATQSAGRVRRWSKDVLDFCEEAGKHISEIRYLQEIKAKPIEQQIAKAGRDAKGFDKQAEIIIEKAKELEAEMDTIIKTAPKKVSSIRGAAKTTSDALSFVNNTAQTIWSIVVYGFYLLLALIGFGIVLTIIAVVLAR